MASLNVGRHFGYLIVARSLRIALTEAKLPPKRCRKLAEMDSGSKSPQKRSLQLTQAHLRSKITLETLPGVRYDGALKQNHP